MSEPVAYRLVTKYSGSTPVHRSLWVNPGENSYKPHMLWNHNSLATFLSLTVKAHVHTVTHGYTGQLRVTTYMYAAVRKAHFKLNRAFKDIQGHPYWCRQKSRTACRRNAQLMPTLFLKLTKGTLQILRFQWPHSGLTSDDAPARNAFEYLTNDLWCQKLELLTYIFTADSMGLCLLDFTQLSLKAEPSECNAASTKTDFYMK